MILHLIPEAILLNTFHGAYKDVLSRMKRLERRPDYLRIPVRADDPDEMERLLHDHRPDQLLFEYTQSVRMVRRARALRPDIQIAVRAHNVEPLQHVDNYGWFGKKGPAWMLYGMMRLLGMDTQMKRLADVILSINEWENRVYWNLLPGRAKVEWLPYITPEHLLPANPEPFATRNIIACLPTSLENRKSRDLVLRFYRFARRLRQHGCDDSFMITGDLSGWDLPGCLEVTQVGFVENLADFMGRCRAVCMLSPLGYGFKTTMADAMAAGAHVIAHPALIRRSPNIIRPFLLSSCQNYDALITALQSETFTGTLQVALRNRADEVMTRYFGAIA